MYTYLTLSMTFFDKKKIYQFSYLIVKWTSLCDTEGLILLNAISKCFSLTTSFSAIGLLMNSLSANSDASRIRADRSAPVKV
ncbi:hypothetical protein BpHYR1_039888 [Brachionus plicatilis]|uniref:Uncharacterized protein n=1 Tax=Brachionus plicatilis TaxID=10195 RepID=A0A3M7S4V7_BRAPC|nr:hypothetical protein BpHYR1_039888 [Brachionus plicatilis]